jgi:hypothetical protein
LILPQSGSLISLHCVRSALPLQVSIAVAVFVVVVVTALVIVLVLVLVLVVDVVILVVIVIVVVVVMVIVVVAVMVQVLVQVSHIAGHSVRVTFTSESNPLVDAQLAGPRVAHSTGSADPPHGAMVVEVVASVWYDMVWYMSVMKTWRRKHPGPASDRDNVTRQTLRAGIRAPPPEKPYVSNVIGGTGINRDRCLRRSFGCSTQ